LASINHTLYEIAALYLRFLFFSVSIVSGVIEVQFSLYGLTSSYRGSLDVQNGRIVVVDPSLSSAAGRIVDADDISAIFEDEVAELLARSNIRPTDVSLRDGSVVITTVAAT
jgi:hypothetical protein